MLAPLVLIVVALTAILGVLWFRRIEETRGQRFFDEVRTTFDVWAADVWRVLVMGGIPMAWRSYVRAVVHDVTHLLVRVAVEVVRAIERPLAKLSYKMRVSAPKSGAAPVSEFLKILTPEKK